MDMTKRKPAAKPRQAKRAKAATFGCPHCGNADLSQILWQEWIASMRRVIGLTRGGVPLVDSESYQDDPGYATGRDRAFVCLECGHEWPDRGRRASEHDTRSAFVQRYGKRVLREE